MPFVCLCEPPEIPMLDFVKRFGDNLRHARELAGLTQVQVAQRMGLKRNSTIAVWESRDRPPKPKTVGRLAHAIGCPPSVLMDEVPSGYDEFKPAGPHLDYFVHDAPRPPMPDDDEDLDTEKE